MGHDYGLRTDACAKGESVLMAGIEHQIEVQAVGPFMKNGFVVWCPRTREAALIDPGDEVDGLLTFAERHTLSIRAILLTHAHVDHITGVATAKRAVGAPIYLHRDDLFLYEGAVQQGAMFGLRVEAQPPVDVFYSADTSVVVGDLAFTPFHTPGHCPGGVCLLLRSRASEPGEVDHLFVGDTLFASSIGRTDLPGGDYETLIRSIRTVLFAFGDASRVYPGHGPSTTIGHERLTNPFLRPA